jgi:hypothetical protein
MPNVPISTFTVPANTVGIGATGYSLTGSANASFMDLAGTWNTSGTPTAIKLNITDTASNAASLLMDLQVGGSSRLGVGKNGRIFSTSGPIGGVALSSSVSSTNFFEIIGDGGAFFCLGGNIVASINRSGQKGIGVTSDSNFNFNSSATSAVSNGDTILTRRGAANLRLGAADAAAPVAQTLSVQSVVAGTTNTAGTNFTFTGSQGTGTGAGGSLIFQVAPAGSSGTAQNALVDALTINSARQALFTGGTSALPGVSFSGTATTGFYSLSSSFIGISLANNKVISFGTIAGAANGIVSVSAGGALAIASADAEGGVDVALRRDAANTLALRNGVNAQTFNVYNTFTSSTNFERFRIFAQSAAAVLIGTEKGSAGGTARALELQTDATTRLTIAGTSGDVTTTGSVTTAAPAGGTAAAWKLGAVATVTPTLQNRTIEVDIGGTIYYISAKTTND